LTQFIEQTLGVRSKKQNLHSSLQLAINLAQLAINLGQLAINLGQLAINLEQLAINLAQIAIDCDPFENNFAFLQYPFSAIIS